MLTWTIPSFDGAPSFAKWKGAIFGYVTTTAIEGRWISKVMPTGDSMERSMHCYTVSEAKAKQFVEKWAKYHSGTITAKAIVAKRHLGAG